MNSVAFHTRHAGGHDPVRVVFVLAATALLALAPVLAGLDERARVALFAFAVLLLGLPHGALDVPVSRALGVWRDGWGFARFVVIYVAVAAGALLLWLAAPAAGFAALLALSAWHFRHDWAGPVGTVGALGVIGWPALWHERETAAIFALLAGPEAGAALAEALAWVGALALAALVLTAFLAWRCREDRGEVLEVALLALLAAALHPLLFFAAYFCALHAPRHTQHTLASYGPAVRREALGAAGCALLAAGAIVVAAIAATHWSLWRDLPEAFVAAVFAGLLCLTVPHVFLVERLEA